MEYFAGFTDLTLFEKTFVYILLIGFILLIVAPGIILLTVGAVKYKRSRPTAKSNIWYVYLILGVIYFICIPGYYFVQNISQKHSTLSSFSEDILVLEPNEGKISVSSLQKRFGNVIVIYYIYEKDGKNYTIFTNQISQSGIAECKELPRCEYDYIGKVTIADGSYLYLDATGANSAPLYRKTSGQGVISIEFATNSPDGELGRASLVELAQTLEVVDNEIWFSIKATWPLNQFF